MAFPTKDGAKKFGSKFAQRKYDQHHPVEETNPKAGESDMGLNAPKKPTEPKAPSKMNAMGMAHEGSESPEFEAGEQEGAQEGASEAPEQVVAKHGKAAHVHVSHDHAANKHHVHSVHSDGHVHDSDHASAPEATMAAKKLGGGDEMAQENPEGMGEEAPEADGFRMPRLA